MSNLRYKELKFEGKTYTKKYQIDEILLKNGFNWFLDAEVENVRIEIMKETLILNAGIWYNGIWEFGVIRDVDWRAGTFKNGVIYNGVFKKITIEKGIIFNGIFLRGDILFADIRGGEFRDINISTNVNQTQQSETQTQPIQNNSTVQIKDEIQGEVGQKIQSQIEENYNSEILKFKNFINEMFLNVFNEKDKLALNLIKNFLKEFKTNKDLKMIQETPNEYKFKFNNGDVIIFNPIQFKKLNDNTPYIIKYNFNNIEISQNTYNKIKKICKYIIEIKNEINQNKNYEELVEIIGKDIKKYVEDKFQLFYNIEKRIPHCKFFNIFNTIIGETICCNFGSTNTISPYENYYNDISSIHIHNNNTITFIYSYPQFKQYKSFTIPVNWAVNVISKWKPKIEELIKKKNI